MSPYMGGMRPADSPEGNPMLTKAFWSATFERAVATFCQALIAVIGVGVLTPADIDWKQVLLGAGVATALSVLKSIVASGIGNSGPSLTSAEKLPVPPAIDPEV